MDCKTESVELSDSVQDSNIPLVGAICFYTSNTHLLAFYSLHNEQRSVYVEGEIILLPMVQVIRQIKRYRCIENNVLTGLYTPMRFYTPRSSLNVMRNLLLVKFFELQILPEID